MTERLAIISLDLSHFRSHLHTQVVLDGRPVAIFGPNGAGKTNLVEGVSLLSPGRGLRRAASADLARAPELIGWKITADVKGPSGHHSIETWSEGAGRQVMLDGKPALQAALGGILRVLWLTPAMDRLWTEGASDRRRYLDRIVMSLIPDHGDTVLTYEKALRERNLLLRDRVRDWAWYDALESQMAAYGAQLTANRQAALLSLAASAEPDAGFPTADLSLVTDALDPTATLGDALREGRARDMAAGRCLTGPHRDDLGALYSAKGMEARLCSTGEQKALLISLILANARAVAATFGAPPILLLDEVAAHLDRDRREALFDAICKLQVQAWMTGTDSELFSSLGDRAERLALSEANGKSYLVTAR